jgi:hypothetical protein
VSCAHATGSKLIVSTFRGFDGAGVGAGAGVFILSWDMCSPVCVCESPGSSDVVRLECLLGHAGLVVLCVSVGLGMGALDEGDFDKLADATASRLDVGRAVSVLLLGQTAMPLMIHTSLGVGHVSEASAGGKMNVDVDVLSSTSVLVKTMVLVQPADATVAVGEVVTLANDGVNL